ncbi:MAG TPA: hypothetical protein DCL15_04275 [Chloroflexi bacterium]|nr:hypothetical protein [Chloroflexota bacterium]HHW85372.1 glycosyltransferase family 4 protein [Chloroflexota bacterium]
MRLCYLADPTSSHTSKWLSYFLNRGDEVHLLGWNPPTDPALARAYYYHLPDVLPQVFPALVRSVLWHANAWPLVHWRQWGVLLDQIRPDVFDILMLNAHQIPAALARRGPMVITPWGSDLLVYPQGYTPLTRWFLGRALRRADLVLCNSVALAQAAVSLGARAERIRRVGQIVDLTRFRPGLDATQLRRSLRLDGGPVLLSPRNLQPLYNIHVLIHAMPMILAQCPTAKLILLGKRELDPPYVHYLEHEIKRLGLSEAVRYAGWFANDEMPLLYALADVVLSIPTSDSRPSSVFEAMACRVPVVVSDLSSLREIVKPEETGLVAPVGDAVGTAAAVLRLLQDESLCRHLVQHGLEFVRQEGDYNVQMAKVAACYEELLSGKTTCAVSVG